MHALNDWHAILLIMVFCGIFSYDLLMGLASKRWAQTTGLITDVKVPTWQRLEERRVTVGYTYNVDDHAYSGHRVSYPDPIAGGHSVLYSDYPEGSNVVVYYNPKNPRNSCLRPGFKPNAMTALLLIVFLACVSILSISSNRILPPS